MGSGIRCKCKSCGYETSVYFSVGFMFPDVYAETVKKMREGHFGEFSQKFFVEHPDGAVNCENIALVCPKCNRIGRGPDLTMYTPKPGYTLEKNVGRWSVALPFEGAAYVSPWDLVENYNEYAKFNHICPECGTQVLALDEDSFAKKLKDGEILCPKCGDTLEKRGYIMWD